MPHDPHPHDPHPDLLPRERERSREQTMNDLTASTDLHAHMLAMGESARAASRALARATTAAKNRALTEAANALVARENSILAANAEDVKGARAEGRDDAFIDRLKLTAKAIEAMAEGLREIAKLPDPVGEVTGLTYRPPGIQVGKMRVPLGVIGIIYESRPNVTADAGGLCLKSGNACILRGGSDSFESSRAITACMQAGLKAAGLPEASIQLVPTVDRAAVGIMLTMTDHIDVIIPRGGKSLIKRVAEESRIPVIKHLDGICHVYVDAASDPRKARDIVLNAKMRRTSVCGAAETLLVDRAVADDQLPAIISTLIEAGCEVRGDEATQALN